MAYAELCQKKGGSKLLIRSQLAFFNDFFKKFEEILQPSQTWNSTPGTAYSSGAALQLANDIVDHMAKISRNNLSLNFL